MKMHLLSLLLTVSIGVTVHAQVKQPPPPNPDYDTMMVKASVFAEEREYAKAIELLKDIPESDTAYATALDKLTLAYLGGKMG